MATELKVKKKTSEGYILENGVIIEDTFADTCQHTVMMHSVLGTTPSFFAN